MGQKSMEQSRLVKLPFFFVDFDDCVDGSFVLHLARNRLRPLDPALGNVEGNVADGPESSGDQADAQTTQKF